MEETKLVNLLEKVRDEGTLLSFVKALLKERYESVELEKKDPANIYGPANLGWENTTLESFFDGALAWAEDTDFGRSQGINENPWYKFATFLYCGKIYE